MNINSEGFLSILPFDILDKIMLKNNLSTILELRKTNKYYKTYIDNALGSNYLLIKQFDPSIFIDIPASHVINQQLNMKQFLYMLIDPEHRISQDILWSEFPNITKDLKMVKYVDNNDIKYQHIKYSFKNNILNFKNSVTDIDGKLIPAKFIYYHGHLEYEYFIVNNLLHNDNGPAIISYFENGQIRSKSYHINGKICDGLSQIYYYENGQIKTKVYMLNENFHNNDGPAIINYYENGELQSEYYFINGKKI